MILSRFFFKYGAFILLVIMFLGTLYMLDNVSIRCKTQADLLCRDSLYIAYVVKDGHFTTNVGQPLEIDFGDSGKLLFKVTDVKEENYYFLLHLDPESPKKKIEMGFAGNTRLTGYVFAYNMKLMQLVFRKFR